MLVAQAPHHVATKSVCSLDNVSCGSGLNSLITGDHVSLVWLLICTRELFVNAGAGWGGHTLSGVGRAERTPVRSLKLPPKICTSKAVTPAWGHRENRVPCSHLFLFCFSDMSGTCLEL